MPRILVLEDSILSRRIIKRILTAADYEVLEAADGKRGLAIVDTEAIDCILLDLLMPEMDGQTFLANLRQQKTAIPVVVISADIQESTRQRCLELGALAVLSKPTNSEELLRVLQRVLPPEYPRPNP